MNQLLKHIELEAYQRLLTAAVGEEAPLAIIANDGSVLWSSESCNPLGFGTWLGELRGELADLDALVRCQIDEGAMVLATPVQRGNVRPGSVATVLSRGASRDSAIDQRACDALRAVGDALGRDIQREVEIGGLADELTGRNEEMHIVYSFEQQFGRLRSASEGMETILHELGETMRLDFVAIVRPGEAPIVGGTPVKAMSNLDLILTQLEHTFFRFVKAGREQVLINEVDDPRRSYLFVDMPFRVLAYPLTHDDDVDGMLVMLRSPKRPNFASADAALGSAIAHQVELLLRNESMINKMERFGRQTARSLIAAVEAKDPYTAGHSERVQTVSVSLARALRVTSREIDDVSWGALFHDIGKIAIPDAILSKRGKLTKDEYTVIKTHPERSYEILRHIDHVSGGALQGARSHHERFDGRGYPDGLIGKQIPNEARIIAIADTYDAITTSRSYRAATPHAKAVETILEVGGAQLDPDVVATFDRLCQTRPTWIRDDDPDAP